MQDSDQGLPGFEGALDGSDLTIALVQARFNDAITSSLASACLAELSVLGVPAEAIRHVTVPGALEETNDYDALIALGCIIRGETYHFELVANESGSAVTRVGLDHGIPIANAILTVENEAQAWARAEPKGRDAARVAVEMANLLKEIE
jgi:6,7-dimethyl-8-ribityllumazine synthase